MPPILCYGPGRFKPVQWAQSQDPTCLAGRSSMATPRVHPLVTHTQRRGYALPLVLASFRNYASCFGCAADATALTVQSHGDDFVKVGRHSHPLGGGSRSILPLRTPLSRGDARGGGSRGGAVRACVRGCMQFVESECQRQMDREDQEHAARLASGSYAEAAPPYSVGTSDLAYARSSHTRPSHGAVARPPPQVVQSSLAQHFTLRPWPAARGPLATAVPFAPSRQQDDSRLDELDLANTKVKRPYTQTPARTLFSRAVLLPTCCSPTRCMGSCALMPLRPLI